MSDRNVSRGAQELRPLIDAAMKELDADAARLSRALRALRADDDSPAVFSALAIARRHALSWFGKVHSLKTTDPAKSIALTALSVLAAALGSYYRALRARDPVKAQKEDRLAVERFASATKAFADLDRALGCPYGCKKG